MGIYKDWTPDERSALIEGWNAGESLTQLTEVFPDRNTNSIRMQVQWLRKLGVPLAIRHHRERVLGVAEAAKREKEMRDAEAYRSRQRWRSAELWPDENSGVILFTDNVKTVAVGKLGQSPMNRSYGTASSWAVKDGL